VWWWWIVDVCSVIIIIRDYPELSTGNKLISSFLMPRPRNALANIEHRIWIRGLIPLGIISPTAIPQRPTTGKKRERVVYDNKIPKSEGYLQFNTRDPSISPGRHHPEVYKHQRRRTEVGQSVLEYGVSLLR